MMNSAEYMLAPFTFFIQQVFLLSYRLTNNYGVSIILLSLAVSLILLPIFILIERARKRDDAIKQRMKPRLEEIKRCYRGQERYYYIRTLHRQHGYSAFRSLIPVLSLLLQIPFFIAAYQFLEHFDPLEGQRFLGIQDLSAPDGLLGAVNLLPIVMTIVNVITAYFYTRRGDAAERKQMLVVAGIFLVLLYRFPAGLVLYWTMNNVFSFFRLFITNPEVFRKESDTGTSPVTARMKARNGAPSAGVETIAFREVFMRTFRPLFIILTGVAMTWQVVWAANHTFDDIFLRIALSMVAGTVIALPVAWVMVFFRDRIAFRSANFSTVISGLLTGLRNGFFGRLREFGIPAWVFYGFSLLTAYFYLGSRYYYGGMQKELGAIALAIMLLGQMAGMVYVIGTHRSVGNVRTRIAAVLLGILFIIQCIWTWSGATDREVTFSIGTLTLPLLTSRLTDVAVPGILFMLVIAVFGSYAGTGLYPQRTRAGTAGYMLSILYLLGFIFLWHPLIVFSSYPSNFDFAAVDILRTNASLFALLFAVFGAAYFLVPRRWRHILLIVAASTVVLAFVNNTVLPIRVGTLQDAVFLEQRRLAKPVTSYLSEVILILGIVAGIRWVFRKNYHKQFAYALLLLNLVLIGQSLVVAGRSGALLKQAHIPANPSSSLTFSKSEKNVVLVLLDMFHGWYVNRAIQEAPELKSAYEGFVWYPNTLSVSNITASSIGPMLGGYDYTVDKLNQDENRSVEQKITAIAKEFNKRIRADGFRFSGNRIIYTDEDSLTYDTFLPKWHEDWDDLNSKLNIGIVREVNYRLLWNNALFFSAPLVLKPRIYNEGKWLKGEVETNENTSRTQPYNFLRLLPYISVSENTRPNFIYLYCTATHHPWDIIDENGVLTTDVSPYENNKWALNTLAKWIDWMKNNEVYDNTKIILVSDHGPHWWYYKGDIDNDIPVVPNTRDQRINEESMSYFSLMLVKDFGTREPLKKDDRFMGNADVHSIIFGENDPTKTESPPVRTLPAFSVLWERKLWELNQLHISRQYEVTGNMYDLNNWKIVD
jgi:YidC/Oxa1 family membrane protein insertase